MSHQPNPRWGPQSPPDPFNPSPGRGPGRSNSHSSSSTHHSNSNNSEAQYAEYPAHLAHAHAHATAGGARSAGMGGTPGPGTPMHPEDTRLLVSQPSSPVPADFSAALPPQSQGAGRNATMPMRNGSFASSPLNPGSPPTHPHPQFPHQQQQQSTAPYPAFAASSSSSSTPGSSLSNTPNPFSRSSSQIRSPGRSGSGFPSPSVAEDGVIATLGLGTHTSGFPTSMDKGSMVLYRLADERPSSLSRASALSAASHSKEPLLPPPRIPQGKGNRASFGSSSGDSIMSVGTSPGTMGSGSVRGLIPYAYDPAVDENEPLDEEDLLHDPNPNAHLSSKYRAVMDPSSSRGGRGSSEKPRSGSGSSKLGSTTTSAMVRSWKLDEGTGRFGWRGVFNIGMLALLILGLLTLFVFYPVFTFYRDRRFNEAVEGNIRINGTGQAPVLFQMPDPIDTETPDSAKTRTGYDGQQYELVFSDEFNTPGRTFYPGDDPYWEAVDLWYGSTGDLEWYDPQQVTTRDGALIITMDSTSTTQAGLTPNSTAPFTQADNHGLDYRSGMLQSWNKFCFTTGYIEVSVTFPGPDQNTQGYWPGAWTMGNLARPGYGATTDGMWPYTYDSCDVGTYPNQTFKDGSGPAAALHSDASREKYNFELSWLSGQRVSACSCPGSDHPGPAVNIGRGAPEIDIFETEKDKENPTGQVVSQSAQFAPFSHDYVYNNDSSSWQVFNPLTRANTYKGSAVQQAISSLTTTPTDIFQGSGDNFHTFGFEYWSDPKNRQDGYITWQADGQKTYQMWASAVGADQGTDGSGVSARLIPEEPMSIILNLGISQSWQNINLASMIFPAEMKIDYVRVYQRKGHTNTGCNPKDYPTTDYINAHMDAFTNVNLTTWPYPKPKNSQYDGC